MKSLGLIGPYDNTMAFVNVLKKYLKIAQICENNNLNNCWPTKTILTSDGSEVSIDDLTTGASFGTEGYTQANIGLITADGTPIIMSYKDDCQSLEPEKTYTWSTIDNKPVTNDTTSCIAMIYDINGKGRPNKVLQDVKLFHVAGLRKKFECLNYAGICGQSIGFNYSALYLDDPDYNKYAQKAGVKPCTTSLCMQNGDAWLGAYKACDDMGARLPNLHEITNLANTMYHSTFPEGLGGHSGTIYENPLNIPNYNIWSSTEESDGKYYGRGIAVGGSWGGAFTRGRTTHDMAIVCVK